MPSVTESPSDRNPEDFMSLSPVISKKRRRGAEDCTAANGGIRLSSSPRHAHEIHGLGSLHTPTSALERKLAPIRGSVVGGRHDSKRQRVTLPSANLAVTSTTIPISISPADSKVLSTSQGNNSARKSTGVDISPCHICHRKPTQKRELDSYDYCEGCGERTCWICFRECVGLGLVKEEDEGMVIQDGSFKQESKYRDGTRKGESEDGYQTLPWEKGRVLDHKSMICSRCCVERGTDGEVWCLGCLGGEDIG